MTVEVKGLKEFRKELKALDENAPKALKKAHSRIASRVQGKARANAASAGGAYAKAKNAIRGSGDAVSASIGVSNSGSNPFAQATFWGAKKRTGWYAAGKYADSTGQQFPEWVGNNWDVGDRGQGPYVINYTVAEEERWIREEFMRSVEEIYAGAFDD